MTRKIVIIVIVAVGLLLVAKACVEWAQHSSAKPVKPVAAKDKNWTAEEIATDPEGYMLWADARVAEQVSDRNTRMAAVSSRLAAIKEKQNALLEDIQGAQNICTRMQQAVSRAEDEDRWPAVMGGRTFDKAKAAAVIEAARKHAEDRKPLEQSYQQAVDKMETNLNLLHKDIEQLNRLREKLSLDIESVRLNKNVEEVAKLRKTEQEIAGYSKTVGAMADDSTTNSLPPDYKGPRLNVDELLK